MYSEIVGRAQYHGMAFMATYICKSMALLDGMASAAKIFNISNKDVNMGPDGIYFLIEISTYSRVQFPTEVS
jgi:hypothetical protein